MATHQHFHYILTLGHNITSDLRTIRIKTDDFQSSKEHEDYHEANDGIFMTLASMLFFFVVNKSLTFSVPESVRKNPRRAWKWQNVATSFLHAAITGIGAIMCLIQEPCIIDDMIDAHSSTAYTLICLSTGYFIYDVIDMNLKDPGRQTNELNVHHAFAILCFGIGVVSKKYHGYGMAALLIETSNVFLHSRQLLLLNSFSKSSCWYRSNSLANVGAYILFRFMTLIWLIYCIYQHRRLIPTGTLVSGSSGVCLVSMMSVVHFVRLVKSDFGYHNKKNSAPTTRTKCG